ncbi:MAG: PD-(D/E)XK nuclease family protein [Acidimicrobiia bacterium]
MNPAQQRFIEVLGRKNDTDESGGPEFEVGLRDRLHDDLEDGLGPLADDLDPDDPLWVSKHALGGIHGCEAQFMATRNTFEWSVANARGIVAHKAIELLVHWRGDPPTLDVVDEAIARCADSERGLGGFLQALKEADRAQLRGEVNDLVAKFRESVPRLRPQWYPVTESKSVCELLGGRVILSGKVDLTLGDPKKGDKVIIDLKSGRAVPGHREDLRFYALVETLKLGTPPRALATYYLDSAQPHREDVTTPLLDTAVRRTVDGVRKMVELRTEQREPNRSPGAPCRWCVLIDDCDDGQAELARQRDD